MPVHVPEAGTGAGLSRTGWEVWDCILWMMEDDMYLLMNFFIPLLLPGKVMVNSIRSLYFWSLEHLV